MVAEKFPLLVLVIVLALHILLEVASVKDHDFLHTLHDSWIHAVYQLEVIASLGAFGTWHLERCKFGQRKACGVRKSVDELGLKPERQCQWGVDG